MPTARSPEPRASRVIRLLIAAALVGLVPRAAADQMPGASATAKPDDPVAAFFQQCPHKPPIHVHNDTNPLDPHAIAYTASSLLELEVVRLADWIVGLPFPTADPRPIERGINRLRIGYQRIDHNLLVRRFGEFVDALQLRELSLGDVASTYTIATGGEVNPGSGTLLRVNKLIDWTQRVVGDLNHGAGSLVHRPQGLVQWRAPGRAVDLTQKGVIRTFHTVSVVVVRTLDRGLNGLEYGTDRVLNVSRPLPHADTTVFLRLPLEVYRANAPWIERHRRAVYAGTAEELRGLSHAELFHAAKRAARARPAWWSLERFASPPPTVILVTDQRTFAHAPAALVPYVIPPEWAFEFQQTSDSL